MRTREFAPGTVAVATVRGVEGVRVFKGVGCWAYVEDGNATWISDLGAHDVRPLVVLDLAEYRADYVIESLRDAARRAGQSANGSLNAIADQIADQTRPPKPAEPTGLGAVVEDSHGKKWVRTEYRDFPWCWVGDVKHRVWSEIDVARVLSEGVRHEASS